MEYIRLTKSQNILTSNSYVFDGNVVNSNDINFVINKKENVSIIFLNLNNDIKLNFDILDEANVKFSFLQVKPINILFKGNVHEKALLTCYYADFTQGNVKLVTDINLVGLEAKCLWNLASLASNKDQKEFDVSIYHREKKTVAHINNYGVARDESKLLFSGICHILEGCHESKAHQNSKIMVFDEASDAIAKPILKIDDNDIEASHAAVVGKISDDHMFYLTSKGLSENEARELITYGYLKPILNGFDDEELQEEISKLIEKGI
ncbi:MAG: SufD family Fe-S cluster assembly protein [Bacilli bacterium]|nr:SufD family Fe-S cluster assembly protein [Bacilli bacterium]